MIRCKWQGRLGNVLLQCVGIRLLSIKFNLKVDSYSNNYNFDKLGFKEYSGQNSYDDILNLFDSDVLDLLKETDIKKGIYFDGLFQIKQFVLEYRQDIKDSFDISYDYQNPDNIFIHVRLDDVQNLNPGYEYYKKCLESTSFNIGYISSDSPNSDIVNKLIDEFNLILYQNNPIDAINFAKDFNKIILSEGTFSWWIGMLSKAKEIYYPKILDRGLWHGDIFVYDDWIPITNKK
jgi:hypothetical protein